jgi:hypothetical protein
MAERYGADMTVPEWRERLVCSQCGSRNVDMVVTGDRAAVALTGPALSKSPSRPLSTLKSHSRPRQGIVGLTRKRSFAPAMLTTGSSQLVEQRLRFFQVGRVETLREHAGVNRLSPGFGY